jgi:thioredoxin-like negative regulator of GroEL
MCGSCKDFEPIWTQLATSLETEYKVVRVSIDSKPGMQLAKQQGVLKRGIPAVQIVAGSHSDILMAGKVESLASLKAKVASAALRYKAVRHGATGLMVHSEFYTEHVGDL